jgi:hypothetical protein
VHKRGTAYLLHVATGWLGWGKPEDVSKAGAAKWAMQTPADHAAGQRHERGLDSN